MKAMTYIDQIHAQRINRAGMTLIDIVCASGVALIVGAVVLQFTAIAENVMATINGPGLLQTQLTIATDSICQDVAFANAIPTTTNGGTGLTFTLASIDNAGQPIAGTNDIISYTFDNATGELRRQLTSNGAGRTNSGPLAIARNLSGVNFNVADKTHDQITMTLDTSKLERIVGSNGQRTYTRSLTAQCLTRNN